MSCNLWLDDCVIFFYTTDSILKLNPIPVFNFIHILHFIIILIDSFTITMNNYSIHRNHIKNTYTYKTKMKIFYIEIKLNANITCKR